MRGEHLGTPRMRRLAVNHGVKMKQLQDMPTWDTLKIKLMGWSS